MATMADFSDSISPLSSSDASFVTATRKSSWENPTTTPSPHRNANISKFEVADEPERPLTAIDETWSDWAGITSLLRTLTGDPKAAEEPDRVPRISIDKSALSCDFEPESSPPRLRPPITPSSLPLTSGSLGTCSGEQRRPFQKWIASLHRRASHRSRRAPRGLGDDFHPHAKSSSGSSFAFVSAVKSASIGLGSITTRTRSRPGTMHSRTRTDRSSRLSIAPPRFSEDSTFNTGVLAVMDKAAIGRSIQRRSILEELIATEENYIGDVRFLINVSDLLSSVRTPHSNQT